MKKADPKIAIIGAGPSGVFTAHYLQERGYSNVFILEKLGRVGGLCKTVTVNGHSYDLGANYVVPSYKEVRKVAKKLKAEMYTERPFIAMDIPDDANESVEYSSIFSASTKTVDGDRIPLLRFAIKIMKYIWVRFWLGSFIDKPTFEGVEKYRGGELTKPIGDWLDSKGLSDLTLVFDLPVTLMGYGQMRETPAIYALKFMTVRAFIPMVLKEVPLIGKLISWPRRFTYGYQRFFERMTWDMDVRLGADITSIKRSTDGVEIEYLYDNQNQNVTEPEPHVLNVDYLILACPLRQFTESESIMKLEEWEADHFEEIVHNSYCMTTRSQDFTGKGQQIKKSPLAASLPVPEYNSESPIPYGVAKQWDDTTFAQFYTQTEWPDSRPFEEIEQAVFRGVNKLSQQMGSQPQQEGEDISKSFNRFIYFQHVTTEVMKSGWYTDLEKHQGDNRTFYVGGATNFELIEPIAEYAKNLVANNFPVIPKPTSFSWKTFAKFSMVFLIIFGLTYCSFKPAPDMAYRAYSLGKGDSKAVSERFWQEFQADNIAAITPSDCEDNPTGAEGETLPCVLMAASNADPADSHLSLLVTGLYLWRVQTNLYPELLEQDLKTAIKYGESSTENHNRFGPGFLASAQWLLAMHTDDDALSKTAAKAFIKDSQDWPAFHTFIEVEQVSKRLSPGEEEFGVSYAMAEDSFNYMLAACVFGDLTPTWLRLPPKMKANNLIWNIMYVLTRINGEGICYNNNPAPYGLPGTYIVAGDMHLKKGDFSTAYALYSNSPRTPNFENWSYQHLAYDRMRNMQTYHEEFLKDSGKIMGANQKMAMAGQSEFYCKMCHAK